MSELRDSPISDRDVLTCYTRCPATVSGPGPGLFCCGRFVASLLVHVAAREPLPLAVLQARLATLTERVTDPPALLAVYDAGLAASARILNARCRDSSPLDFGKAGRCTDDARHRSREEVWG